MEALNAIDWSSLLTPGSLAGHLSYFLLVTSIMMRTMLWLRIIAVASGLASFLYGVFWLGDALIVVWELVFVLANLLQLVIMAYENRRQTLTTDEAVLSKATLPSADRAQLRKFLKLGTEQEAAAQSVLIRQGEVPTHLMVITRGTVQVERDGQVIAACGEGDFLGEISFQRAHAEPATADVIVTHALHYTAFERKTLQAFLKRNTDIAGELQSSIGRNVAAKLLRASHEPAQLNAAPPIQDPA